MIQQCKLLYNRILQSNFIRQVILLSGASVIAQAINIGMMPLLARLYTPADFGVLSLFSSVVSLLATVSGFRYYLVLPLARRKRYLQAIVCLSVILQVSFVLVLTILSVFFGKSLIATRFEVLYPYRYLIPICVFAIGMYGMSVQWAISEKSFSLIARTKLTQTVSANIVKVAGAFFGAKPLGLLLGFVIGQSSGGVTLIRHLIRKSGKPRLDPVRIKRAAVSYRNMCLIDTPGALFNMAGAYILPLVIAYFYTDEVVGYFSMAQNLLILPAVVIGDAIGQVFSQKAAEAKYNGTLGLLTGRTFELLAKAGLFPVLICSLFAPEIFTIAFGEQWRQAGYYASIIAPWIAVSFIYSPMSRLFTTLMIQKTALFFTSFYTITRIGSVAMFGDGDSLYAMFALSATGTVMMLIGVALLMAKAGVSQILPRIIKVLIETLISLSPAMMFVISGSRSLIIGIAALSLSLFIYLFLLKKSYQVWANI